MRPTAAAVLNLCVAGDEEAFHAFVLQYTEIVWRVALRVTRSEADVDDVVQETLMRAWLDLPNFHGDSAIETWLTCIAVRCSIDFLRDRERHAFPRLEPGLDVAMDHPGQEREVYSSEIMRVLVREIDRLGEAERIAFVLRHVEGMDTASIARVLGVSEVAARNSIFRALRKLRTALQEQREWTVCI